MVSPAAEIEIDAPLVQALLEDQHPDLGALPLTRLDAGWDNSMWRLGPDLIVRLPRRAVAVELALREQRWLPPLAPTLPLPVPAAVPIGGPAEPVARPGAIVPGVDGEPGDRATLHDPDRSAARLGGFLRALHRPAPDDAPHNSFRGVPLADRAATVAERLAALADEIDGAAVARVWAQAGAAAPFSTPPVWLHGDLHPANVLVHDGVLAGIIDFGDICAGDPATDLAAAWMLLPAPSMPAFRAAYGGVDPDLERRGRGWAALFGLLLLAIGLDDKPTYAAIGRATLARVTGAPPV